MFITKCRHKTLKGDVDLKTRQLIRQTCVAIEMEILDGTVSRDHVHIVISASFNPAPGKKS